MVPVFFLYTIGLIIGLIPPFIWGKIGGDEPLIAKYPRLAGFFKLIHHWQIGIAIVISGFIISTFCPYSYPLDIFIYGWGSSTTLDDIMFHSFESYFKRK